MNEAIAAALCADTYTDPLTLGPFPSIVDSVDVTVQAAAVLAQMYRNVDTGVQALDDREYLLLPGSRTISNVTGIRFRNQIAGIPAIVTASLGGPDLPQIGAVFADTPLVGAPLLTDTPIGTNGVGAAIAFSGVPPAGYSALLIHAVNVGIGGGFLFLAGQLAGGTASRQYVYLPSRGGLGSEIYWVVSLPASSVSVGINFGPLNSNSFVLGVWPTNLPPGTYLPPQDANGPNPVLYQANGLVIAPGSTFADPKPFVGPVKFIAPFGLPANVFLLGNLLDVSGALIGYQFEVGSQDDRFLVPGRCQLQWVNNTGANANVTLSMIGQYGGWTG